MRYVNTIPQEGWTRPGVPASLAELGDFAHIGPRRFLNLLIVAGFLGTIAFLFPIWLKGARPPASVAIQWQSDLDKAVQESVRDRKPLLVFFGTDWYPPCKDMNRYAWNDPRVGGLANARFVPLIVDLDKNPAIAREFHVKASEMPTIKIIRSDGTELYSRTVYHSAEELLAVMAKYADR